VNACPHCRAAAAPARVEPDHALRWRCGVCAGPVVPADGLAARSDEELADLVAAQRQRAMALGWRAAALVLGAIGVMALGVAALLVGASAPAAIVLAVLAALAAGLAWASARRARRRAAEARARLEGAWQRVAEELLRAHAGGLTAAQLAQGMHTDEAHAQALLSGLPAAGRQRPR
jgi:hypothetical protein